jgi:hypothetical protein
MTTTDPTTLRADVHHELHMALTAYNRAGVEMMLSAIGIIPSDDHALNTYRLAEIIAADLKGRFAL